MYSVYSSGPVDVPGPLSVDVMRWGVPDVSGTECSLYTEILLVKILGLFVVADVCG